MNFIQKLLWLASFFCLFFLSFITHSFATENAGLLQNSNSLISESEPPIALEVLSLDNARTVSSELNDDLLLDALFLSLFTFPKSEVRVPYALPESEFIADNVISWHQNSTTPVVIDPLEMRFTLGFGAAATAKAGAKAASKAGGGGPGAHVHFFPLLDWILKVWNIVVIQPVMLIHKMTMALASYGTKMIKDKQAGSKEAAKRVAANVAEAKQKMETLGPELTNELGKQKSLSVKERKKFEKKIGELEKKAGEGGSSKVSIEKAGAKLKGDFEKANRVAEAKAKIKDDIKEFTGKASSEGGELEYAVLRRAIKKLERTGEIADATKSASALSKASDELDTVKKLIRQSLQAQKESQFKKEKIMKMLAERFKTEDTTEGFRGAVKQYREANQKILSYAEDIEGRLVAGERSLLRSRPLRKLVRNMKDAESKSRFDELAAKFSAVDEASGATEPTRRRYQSLQQKAPFRPSYEELVKLVETGDVRKAKNLEASFARGVEEQFKKEFLEHKLLKTSAKVKIRLAERKAAGDPHIGDLEMAKLWLSTRARKHYGARNLNHIAEQRRTAYVKRIRTMSDSEFSTERHRLQELQRRVTEPADGDPPMGQAETLIFRRDQELMKQHMDASMKAMMGGGMAAGFPGLPRAASAGGG